MNRFSKYQWLRNTVQPGSWLGASASSVPAWSGAKSTVDSFGFGIEV